LLINGKTPAIIQHKQICIPVDKLSLYLAVHYFDREIFFTGTPEGVSRVEHGDKLEASLSMAHKNFISFLSVNVQ